MTCLPETDETMAQSRSSSKKTEDDKGKKPPPREIIKKNSGIVPPLVVLLLYSFTARVTSSGSLVGYWEERYGMESYMR